MDPHFNVDPAVISTAVSTSASIATPGPPGTAPTQSAVSAVAAADETIESSWCEISRGALHTNMRLFRQRVGNEVKLGVVVKSNAYGHGTVLAAKEFLAAGADWLVVNFSYEAVVLREGGVGFDVPIYICGNVPVSQCDRVVYSRSRIVLYDADVARAMSQAALEAAAAAAAVADTDGEGPTGQKGWRVPVHIMIETGMHRQGLQIDEAIALGRLVMQLEGLELEGITTHYADMDDGTNDQYAQQQLSGINAARDAFAQAGLPVRMVHSANSAATILCAGAHADLVRVGVASYGLWPSSEAKAAAVHSAKLLAMSDSSSANDGSSGDSRGGKYFVPELVAALSWRARVVQVKTVPAGGYISYGRTFRVPGPDPMRVAVLPLGYHEGYDRHISNMGHVLLHGRRARVCGRVCMNMIIVDVSHAPETKVGDVATLLGRDGSECITAEQMAGWIGTINYEVVTRINACLPRLLVD